MDLNFSGKKCVVLGGMCGIGWVIVDMFVGEGVDVVICVCNVQQIVVVVEDLKVKGVNVIGGLVDVIDGVVFKVWIKLVGEEFGGIDILVLNVGVMVQGYDEVFWKQNFDFDVFGVVNVFEVVELFFVKGVEVNGDVLFVIIVLVFVVVVDQVSFYGLIKVVLIYMVKGLVCQYVKYGICINVVLFGMVYFEGGIWYQVEQNMFDFFKQVILCNLIGCCVMLQEIVNVVVFLVSFVFFFIIGFNLIVDGVVFNWVNF